MKSANFVAVSLQEIKNGEIRKAEDRVGKNNIMNYDFKKNSWMLAFLFDVL